jgi:hypothetical protein
MRSPLRIRPLVIVATILCAVPALAHHAPARVYDQDKTVPVKGKVTEFIWKSPHSELVMNVTDGPYKGRSYAVELNGPSVMIRQGWTQRQFQYGDEVVIHVHPSKTGAAIGECLSCTVIINGKATGAKR